MDNDTTASSDRVWMTRHLWQFTPVQDVFWIGLGIAVIWGGYVLRGVFIPILVALGLAYAVNPLLSTAEKRWNMPRPVVIGLSMAACGVTLISALLFLVPVLVSEIRMLGAKAPDYADAVLTTLHQEMDDSTTTWLSQLKEQLPENGMQLVQVALEHTGQTVGIVGDLMSSTLYVAVSLLLIPIYFVYFVSRFHWLLEQARRLIPDPHRQRVLEIAGRMDKAVGSFLRGRMLITLCMMVMFSTAFWLAGIPYWFLIGTLTGLLSFVPYFAVVGCLIAVFVQWVDAGSQDTGSADWVSIVVWPVAAYGIVQLVEGWLLTPWIQSRSMEMSAVAILIVVFVGGAVGGLYGLLLAIPVAGCIRILCTDVLLPKLEAWAEDT